MMVGATRVAAISSGQKVTGAPDFCSRPSHCERGHLAAYGLIWGKMTAEASLCDDPETNGQIGCGNGMLW